MGGDLRTCEAARVSTKGSTDTTHAELTERDRKLLEVLAKGRHGAPTRHTTATFRIHLPIFVARELRTHWVHNDQLYLDFSYSEESGRYRVLEPVFWLPKRDRPMIEVEGFRAMKPREGLERASVNKYTRIVEDLKGVYQTAWNAYQVLIDQRVSREVARAILPVGIYTSCYMTGNLQALLNLIGLRTHDPEALFVSYPLHEIEDLARQIESFVATEIAPAVHAVFVASGRYGI